MSEAFWFCVALILLVVALKLLFASITCTGKPAGGLTGGPFLGAISEKPQKNWHSANSTGLAAR